MAGEKRERGIQGTAAAHQMTEKTPLVLVPGLLCDAALWSHQTEHLAEIADIRIADTVRDDSIAGMAQRLLNAAPRRFALAGLSMGGYAAFEVVRQAPERVVRLALLDTSARPDDAAKRRRRPDLIQLAEKGPFKGVRRSCVLGQSGDGGLSLGG